MVVSRNNSLVDNWLGTLLECNKAIQSFKSSNTSRNAFKIYVVTFSQLYTNKFCVALSLEKWTGLLLLVALWIPNWEFHPCMFVFKAMVGEECVGAIVCKLDMHKKMFRRGYIAMLAVDSKYRRKGIGKNSLFCSFFLKSSSWDNCSCQKDLRWTELQDVVLCVSSLPYSTTRAPQWLFWFC